MFSKASMILFTGEGAGACMAGACLARWHAWQGGMHGRGQCVAGWHAWQGGMHGS